MRKPRAGSPECGAIVASLPLSRTNRAILQQPFGFELTVPACLDSNQASATDPRPPNSSRTRRWHECKRVHLDGAPTTMPTPLFLRASGKIITLRQKRRTVGGSLRRGAPRRAKMPVRPYDVVTGFDLPLGDSSLTRCFRWRARRDSNS